MAIYRGFSFPVRFENGSLRFSELSNRSGELLSESIRHIGATAIRKRPRRRTFGIGLIQQTFKNLSESNPGVAARMAKEAIANWEPRATVESVKVSADGDGVSTVEVRYSRVDSDETDQVTFELA